MAYGDYRFENAQLGGHTPDAPSQNFAQTLQCLPQKNLHWAIPVQSNLHYPDLDYRDFFSGPVFL